MSQLYPGSSRLYHLLDNSWHSVYAKVVLFAFSNAFLEIYYFIIFWDYNIIPTFSPSLQIHSYFPPCSLSNLWTFFINICSRNILFVCVYTFMWIHAYECTHTHLYIHMYILKYTNTACSGCIRKVSCNYIFRDDHLVLINQ